MVRHNLIPGTTSAARLVAASPKPLENRHLVLLRLEFELFAEIARMPPDGREPKQLKSTGKIVCRDIALGKGVDVETDPGLFPYIGALPVTHRGRVEAWTALSNLPVEQRPWVKITFGSANQADMRNNFADIRPFNAAGYQIDEYDYDLDKEWVTPQEAATRLKTSANTIRRRVKEFEPEHGSNLVRYSDGGHWRIKLLLLRNLLSNK